MAKFRTATPLPPRAATKGRTTVAVPDTLTAEGGAGWSREAKSELFLLAVTNMVSEKAFYEDASQRDERFERLIAQVAAEDPDWVARFVPYLRGTLNLRSASLVMAAELVHAKLTSPQSSSIHNRDIIAGALQRADEPGEMIGYWRSRFGNQLPQPVKRGIAQAVERLYTERSYIKYGAASGVTFSKVLDLTHPDPRDAKQSALFQFILNERHGHAAPLALSTRAGEAAGWPTTEAGTWALPMLAANRQAMALSREEFVREFDDEFVRLGGLTWEQASAKYGKLDARFWVAMISNMGYMALLRNLRNFEEAGISDVATAAVISKLTDTAEIVSSRQMPLRFYSAYRNAGLRWAWALEQALNKSLANVPALPGKTLILSDDSVSMDDKLSSRSDLTRRAAAAMFAAALAARAENGTLIAYADLGVRVRRLPSVLQTAEAVGRATTGGTRTVDVLLEHWKGHDRVVVLTDEQAFAARTGRLSEIDIPVYTFSLAGYEVGGLPTDGRFYTWGGLTDAGFTAIAALEGRRDAGWPF